MDSIKTASAPISVVIADDHSLFREALRKLLESEAGFRVIGEASNGRDAVRLARDLRPDVLLLDMRMPVTSGLEALRELSGVTPAIRTLLLAAEMDDSDVIDALQLGACGVVLKQSATELLFKSIRTVMAGEYWVGRDRVADLIEKLRQRQPKLRTEPGLRTFGLTPREMEMVSAVVEGYPNEDIARKFSISVKTVKQHLTNVFVKVGVSTRLELALVAVDHHHLDAAV